MNQRRDGCQREREPLPLALLSSPAGGLQLVPCLSLGPFRSIALNTKSKTDEARAHTYKHTQSHIHAGLLFTSGTSLPQNTAAPRGAEGFWELLLLCRRCAAEFQEQTDE